VTDPAPGGTGAGEAASEGAAVAGGGPASDRPAPGRRLRVVIAPDSFKGSLTSVEVAAAISAGWLAARPGDETIPAPLADGGAGTIDAFIAAGGWEVREAVARDPLGRPVTARWLVANDGRRAFVEMAEANGLARTSADDRARGAARRATTFGTGDLIIAALDAGIRDVVLGLGGSATTDGGAGMLQALGARVMDEHGDQVAAGGAGLADVRLVALDELDPRLAELHLRVACDVTNPLLGPDGAAAMYGPQKGATPSDVVELDAALGRWADILERDAAHGTAARATVARAPLPRDVPGAGAAGGTPFALIAVAGHLASFSLVPGVAVVIAEVGLPARVAGADLVITGEGRVDAQTAFGKTALGVARLARDAGVPCLALGGGVTPEGAAALAAVGALAIPVVEGPITVEEAMAAGPGPVARAAERVARLVTIGALLAERPA
jgi:glycerate kinase